MESAKIKTSAIAQAEIQRRRRAQRMETAKIKTSAIVQAEIPTLKVRDQTFAL